MEKVNLNTIKPWITERLNDLLGFEDDVVIEFVFNLLESNQVWVILHITMTTKICCIAACMVISLQT